MSVSDFMLIATAALQINAIMFYAPQVFSTFGSGRKAALLNTVIIGAGETHLLLLSDGCGEEFLTMLFRACKQ